MKIRCPRCKKYYDLPEDSDLTEFLEKNGWTQIMDDDNSGHWECCLWRNNTECPQCGKPIINLKEFVSCETGYSYCSNECAAIHVKENWCPECEQMNDNCKCFEKEFPENLFEDLDPSAKDYIANYPMLPEPNSLCRECKGPIKVFSFLEGLCIKCYLKQKEALKSHDCNM